jgi:hypothetical protein
MRLHRNPIARNGDFADPFVLRYDGRFFLYCTNPDIRVWSSADLIEWTLEGPAIEDGTFPGLVPFAPEVVYDDGAFLMYTSPSGHGHRVLRAEAPTGPFRPITGDLGHAIDGNVLLDDDGRRYFYWAGDEGIWGCELTGADGFGEPVLTGVTMHGWTEGPFVMKRDGAYLMTLTGNHYLSHGYRIDAAWSRHPLTGWRSDPLNPILVSTSGPVVGLGHSSSVAGPDLVSTWIVYHNLNPDASRDLDLDRQVHSGRSVQALGPSRSAPSPDAADAVAGPEDWRVASGALEFRDGAGVLTGERASAIWGVATGDVFTAELNLTGDGGVTLDGELVPLPEGLSAGALHRWLIEVDGELRLTVDGRLHLVQDHVGELALGVGTVRGPLRIGHCALTRSTSARADRASVKPVPGRFWAALGTDGDAAPERVLEEEHPAERLAFREGEAISYALHVQDPGAARIHLAGSFAEGDELAVELDGATHRVRAERNGTLLSAAVELAAASSRLTLRVVRGRPILDLVTVSPAAEPGPAELADERQAGTGKRVLPGTWDDVEVTARVRAAFEGPGAHADLLLRASQPAEGGEGDDPVLGFDFLLGYSVQLHPDRVVLARHDYASRTLAEHPATVDPAVAHDLALRARGGHISVELDGRRLLEVDDALPHALGQLGLRTWNAHLHVEILRIGVPPHPRARL